MGNGVNLSAASAGATNYTWMPGNLLGSNVTVFPTGTTTYTVFTDNGLGCIEQATVTVNVFTATPSFALDYDPFFCIPKGNLAGSVTVSATPVGIYTLTSPIATFPFTTQVQFNHTVVISPTATTVYTISALDLSGCYTSTTVTLTQVPCQCLAVSGTTIGGIVALPQVNPGNIVLKAVSNVTLVDIFNPGSPLYGFTGNEVIVYPGVKITLANVSGGTVYIDGSYVHGCGELWEGFVMPFTDTKVRIAPAANSGLTTLIEDAKTAITFLNQTAQISQLFYNPDCYLEVNNATFNKNITAIRVLNYQTPTPLNNPYKIYNSLFTSRTIPITPNPNNPNGVSSWPATTTIKNSSSGLSTMETPHINSSIYTPVQIASVLYGYFDYPLSGVELINIGFTDQSQSPPVYKGMTIGQPGNPNYNCFDHLQGDIILTNSNVRIFNSVFQYAVRNQKTNNLTGGDGISAVSTGGNKNQLIVGNNAGHGNASFPCFFYDKTSAIDVADYHDIEVTNASFYSVLNNYLQFLQGNTFGGKGINVQTNRYLRIFANNNVFYNIKNPVMAVINNQLQHIGLTREVGQISVDNNSINRWNNIPIPPNANPYVNIGVYVADPINVPGVFVTFNQAVSVDISNNTFNKVHNGISSVNFAYTPVSINANTMTILNQPIQFCSLNCLQRGIFVANQVKSTGVNLNSITGPAFVWGDSLKGISTANNMSLAVRCNTTANTARGIEFNGREAIDFYEDNSMIGSTVPNPSSPAFGHVLDNQATLNAPNFVVGSAGRPTNNIWQQPWQSAIGGDKTATFNSSAKLARMYIQFSGQFDPSNSAFTNGNSQVPPGPDQYTYSVNYSNTFWTLLPANILPPIQYGCRIGQGGGGGAAGQVALLEQIASPGLNYQNNQVQNAAIDEHFAYRSVKANPITMVNSATLTNFYANAQTNNLQGMASIEENLANNNLNTAQSQINGFTPSNSVETNYKSYYQILKSWKDSTYTQNDSLNLKTLANGCPYVDGMVVYQAQTLYNAIYKDYFKFYENCSGNNQQARLINQNAEEKKTENYLQKSAIFPNPNNGNFVLRYSNPIEKQSAEISIFDITGRLVYHENRQIEREQEMKLGNDLLNGTYLIKVKLEDGTTDVHRLVISK